MQGIGGCLKNIPPTHIAAVLNFSPEGNFVKMFHISAEVKRVYRIIIGRWLAHL